MEPAGTSKSPNTTLFLLPDGSSTGMTDSTHFTKNIAMFAPVNKKNWIVSYDSGCRTLSGPQLDDGHHAAHSKYPAQMTVNLNLPCFNKVHLDSQNIPSDYDYRTSIVVLHSMMTDFGDPPDITIDICNALTLHTDM